MKKIGILTMHKVINFGSALQAYATQKFIEKLGYECELIDYLYPIKRKKKSIKQRLISLMPTSFKAETLKHG